MTAADEALVDAARREVASRERAYPSKVAAGRRELVADYQAWCVILKWLATGRFEMLEQGGFDGKQRVGWPECQAAAEKALATRTAAAEAETDEAKAAAKWQLRASVAKIVRKVTLRRQSIDDLNAHFRAQRDAGRKAA